MSQRINHIVDTTKYSAMAEFRRRTEGRTSLKNVVKILEEVGKIYGVRTIVRQGSLYPNVYTLGYRDECDGEVTTAFTIQE